MAVAEKSVRHKVLEAMADVIRNIEPMEPPAVDPLDDWSIRFSTVALGPLGETDLRKRYSAGVVPGAEKKQHRYPLIDVDLSVAVEFRVVVNVGDGSPANMAEAALTVLQRAFYANKTLGGIAVDVNETGSEIDLETYGDKSVVGVIFFSVKYRHAHTDPREPDPIA